MINTFNNEKEKKDLLNLKKKRGELWQGKKENKQNKPTGNSRTESYI